MQIAESDIPSSRPRLLVAEDNPGNYKLVEVILRQSCDLMHAVNGREAVEMYRTYRPDAVLMDIGMPEMDGYEALRAIRAADPAARVIALTAYAFETDRQRIQRAGFDFFLAKPLRVDELRSAVARVLGRDTNKQGL